MKFENSWKQKTLEALENSIWEKPEFDSNLVITCHKLRKKKLKDFSSGDLRIMIGQNFSLKYLIPLAIEDLEKDILVDGGFYQGDLLKVVLTSDVDYWKKNHSHWKTICNLFHKNLNKIKDYCYQNHCKNEWIDDFEKFVTVNSEKEILNANET